MPLIKQRAAERTTRGAIVLDLGDLRRQGEAILEEARREAEAIIARAEVEAQALIDSADQRGLAQGMERGLAEGLEQGTREGTEAAKQEHGDRLHVIGESWSQTLELWESDRGQMMLSAREDVLRFAFAMSRKIVLRTAALDASVIEDQVAEALALLCRPSAVTIVINPDDQPVVEEMLPELLSRLARCEHAEIQADPSIRRGGCAVRTGEGLIDATLERQIDRIAETLLPGGRGYTGAREDEM